MGISDNLNRNLTRRCIVGQLLDDLDTDDRQAIETYIANARLDKERRPHATRYPIKHLEQVLEAEGHHISYKSLCQHAFGACICEVIAS